jgi:hypothetical protein
MLVLDSAAFAFVLVTEKVLIQKLNEFASHPCAVAHDRSCRFTAHLANFACPRRFGVWHFLSLQGAVDRSDGIRVVDGPVSIRVLAEVKEIRPVRCRCAIAIQQGNARFFESFA